MKTITKNEQETIAFAGDFAGKLKGGEVIGLIGDLGTGKTVFAKGLARGLGIKDNVTSPTFVLMKVYSIGRKSGNVRELVHIDAYRIKTAADITAIGAAEYFRRKDTITVIEWADKIKKILPKSTIFVKFTNTAPGRRIIRSS